MTFPKCFTRIGVTVSDATVARLERKRNAAQVFTECSAEGCRFLYYFQRLKLEVVVSWLRIVVVCGYFLVPSSFVLLLVREP